MGRPDENGDDWLEPYRGYLLVVARCLVPLWLRAHCDPEDAVQKTFLQAWQARAQYAGKTEAELKGWLVAILINVVKGMLKRQPRWQPVVEESSRRLENLLPPDLSTPSGRAMRAERSARVLDALAQLPEDEREAVSLKYLDGLTSPEIARIMGRTRGSVAGLLARGLKRLKALLGQDEGES
jgi:RNA polymerase sigma-70 factor (ECF subfamily)